NAEPLFPILSTALPLRNGGSRDPRTGRRREMHPETAENAPPAVSVWRRLRLAAEIALLYIAAPIFIYDLVYVERVPLFRLLPWIFGVFALLLVLQRDRSWVWAFARLPRLQDLFSILVLFIFLGGALAWYAQENFPGRFLRFPRVAYDLWLQVM